MQGYTLQCYWLNFLSQFLLIFYILSGQATASWKTEITRSYQGVLHHAVELPANSQSKCIYQVLKLQHTYILLLKSLMCISDTVLHFPTEEGISLMAVL